MKFHFIFNLIILASINIQKKNGLNIIKFISGYFGYRYYYLKDQKKYSLHLTLEGQSHLTFQGMANNNYIFTQRVEDFTQCLIKP